MPFSSQRWASLLYKEEAWMPAIVVNWPVVLHNTSRQPNPTKGRIAALVLCQKSRIVKAPPSLAGSRGLDSPASIHRKTPLPLKMVHW